MKFLVSDHQPELHERIQAFLTPDTALIAALLAAVDLEWTIRRVIDKALNAQEGLVEQKRVSGLENYAKAWSRVIRGPGSRRLQDVVGSWDELLDAYQLRHDIVHGRQGTGGVRYIKQRVQRMHAASASVVAFG